MNADLALIRYSLRCGTYDSAVDEATLALERGKQKKRGQVMFWKACSIGEHARFHSATANLLQCKILSKHTALIIVLLFAFLSLLLQK